MLKSNSIRFVTDTFGDALTFVDEPVDPVTPDPDEPQPTPEEPTPTVLYKTAFLISKTPLDCSKASVVDQFVITGSEPDGSRRRLVFIIDGNTYRFKNGTLIAFNYDCDYDGVINHGNSVNTLANLSDITGFVGKKIYPVIAMRAPYDADEFPTIKISLATRTFSDQLINTADSPVYELADEAETITDITAKTKCTGNGEVDISVRLCKDGTWSSFMSLAEAADNLADAVQFRMKYTVTTADGSDSAQVQSITVSHASGQNIITGNTANLFSKVQNYEVDLKTCFVVVRHDPLIDAVLECYVNFMPAPKHRELIQIGIGTGSRQELSLGDSHIVPASIKLYENGEPFYDFDFSTELGTVILTAKKNAVIAASYDYDYGEEVWLKMTAEESQPYNDDNGTYSTRFTYSLDEPDKKISNVRIRMRRQSGSATESLGKASGKTQLFTLKHKAKPSTIEFTNDVKDFNYDEDSGILSVVAAKNTALNISYDWQGNAIVVYSFAAGWSAT